jgi:hypothetical protein
MIGRASSTWQLILADLALILFLVALTALLFDKDEAVAAPFALQPTGEIAPSQSLFRPSASGPSLTQWLAQQERDPRATLTIIALVSDPENKEDWSQAQRLASEASKSGMRVRTVILQGRESEIYATLGYDALALPE